MEPTITKRLHISGLTPSISEQDLSQRLSTFGNVKTLDGLGLLDATGQPRKFAYVTLEATPAKLSKCMNTLSGSTWKGTKLRIGEAKPDFRERIRAENEKAALAEPPRKKSRWKFAPYHATHAKDMTPITLETAQLKGGWIVTPLGRIHRPLRMRPLRPLQSLSTGVTKVVKGKRMDLKAKFRERKRVKKFDTRARRRKIDMTKYGSVYIKGRFLDVDVPPGVGTGVVEDVRVSFEEDSDEESREDTGDEVDEVEEGNEKNETDETEMDEDEREERTMTATKSETPIETRKGKPHIHSPTALQPSTNPDLNLDLEAKKSLNILSSLFGSSASVPDNQESRSDDDWIGKESLGSDVDEAALVQETVLRGGTNQVDYEIVPRDGDHGKRRAEVIVGNDDSEMRMDVVDEEEGEQRIDEEERVVEPVPHATKAVPAQTSNRLKDLFAPSEAGGGGFSLLGHLDLDVDLELDNDVPFPTTYEEDEAHAADDHTSAPTTTTIISSTAPTQNQNQTRRSSQVTLDPSRALFFPLALLSSHPSAPLSSFLSNPNVKNQRKDAFDTLKAKGWDWSSGFYRTQNEDEIRQRWEGQKSELTQGWKKRWREAGRFKRRRGRVGGEDG